MGTSFLLAFCRIAVGLVFVTSIWGKSRDIPSFVRAISNFKFLPQSFSKPLAYLFLLGEIGTVLAMLIGGSLLVWGFLLASVMLLSFSIGLTSVIIRKIKTSCNCFGPDDKVVGVGHVIRSGGFMICGLGGTFLSFFQKGTLIPLGFSGYLIALAVAVVFVFLWTQIDSVFGLFNSKTI